MQSESRHYHPSLEGIRALAFLLVFAVHFSGPTWTLDHRPYRDYPWLLACQLSFAAVPVFLALSGYLITGVLFDSKEKRGYFHVFYLRRVIRVFPLYYLTLGGIYLCGVATGIHFLRRHLLLLTYCYNFWPRNGYYNLSPHLQVGHLWSLAVEEQFYLIWPVVIWLCPGRRKLITIAWSVVGAAFLARLAWACLGISAPEFAYQNTLFRGDAIMLGALLALYRRGPAGSLKRLTKPATGLLTACSVLLVVRALLIGQAMPFDTFGITVVMPLLSLMGTCSVVLCLDPSTLIHHMSTRPWAVSLGKRSYGLYLFHQLLAPYFLATVIPALSNRLGRGFGRVTGMLLAFALTWMLAEAAYRLIEEPAMQWKSRIPYGQSAKVLFLPFRAAFLTRFLPALASLSSRPAER